MRSFEEIVPLLFAIVIAIVLFWGIIIGIKNAMNMPDRKETIEKDAGIELQKRRLEDVQRQQKQFMQDQKQRIKDLRRL